MFISYALAAERSGGTTKRTKSSKSLSRQAQLDIALGIYPHLLDMWATVDDVCTEEGLFSPLKYRINMGRIYEKWLKIRNELDPDFDRHRWALKKRAKYDKG